jgi:hypothetical protein
VIELAVTMKDVDRARHLRNVLLASDIRAYRGVERKLDRELFMVGVVLAVGIDLPGTEVLDTLYLVGPTIRRKIGRGSGMITGWEDTLAVEDVLQRITWFDWQPVLRELERNK